MTNVANPTKWNDDAHGNDFPATYFFDPYKRMEIMMFFDMTAMSWMSLNNIARFLNYRCAFRRRYRPVAGGELGLIANGFSGHLFPAGDQQFAYAIHARSRAQTPTDQEALCLLVDRSVA